MDPILALIGDLYQQIVTLQQQNANLAAQLEQRAAEAAHKEPKAGARKVG